MMTERDFDFCRVRLFPGAAPEGLLWLILDEDESPAALAERIQAERSGLWIAAVSGMNWWDDLSPWAAPPVFGQTAFGGQGPRFLSRLRAEVMPTVEAELPRAVPRYLAGYSLAGLFCLWASCELEGFEGVASASGSLWFDGFGDYLRSHPCQASRAALSVGDREARTKNPRMARVESATREAARTLKEQGLRTHFRLEQGNHFTDAEGRLARAVLEMMRLG